MEDLRQPIKYLTIEDILVVAVDHVGSFQIIKENQLNYLIEVVGAKLGNIDIIPFYESIR